MRMMIDARLESERDMGGLYRIYRPMDDLIPLLKVLREEAASLMNGMTADGKELFKRLFQELEMEEGLVKALPAVQESKNPSMVIKIDARITWCLMLDGRKVSVNEAADG